MTMATRLRDERQARGFSQLVLAKIGGVQPNAQGQYESGRRSPRAEYLHLVHLAGLDVAFIITGVRRADGAELSDQEGATIKSIRLLRPADRIALEQVLTSLTRSPQAHD